MLRQTLAAFALVAAAGSAQAATLGGHSSLIVFGDSLSDTGNLYAATGGAIPAYPYANGRFSNGPVWADDVAKEASDAGLFSANFAYGGATAVTNGDTVPDLTAQIGLFETYVPKVALGDSPLAAIWIGANDLFDALDTTDEAGVIAAGISAAKAVAAGITALAGDGISNFAVFNLPDLGTTPAYALFEPGKAAAATAGSEAYNSELMTQLAGLQDSGLNIATIDAFGLLKQLIADPTAFGVINATTPCYIPNVSYCGADMASKLGFFDPVHISDTIHAHLADAFDEAIAPVPLPASGLVLIGGLAALGAVRRRIAA